MVAERTKVPILRSRSLVRSLAVYAVMMPVFVLSYHGYGQSGLLVACVSLLVYALIAREIVFPDHRRGIRATRRKDWAAAIKAFGASLDDLERHPWKDRWRTLLILSPGSMDYREMGLVNLGFCHAQSGSHAEAVRWYRACLAEYPGNGLAEAALKMLVPAAG